MSTILGLVKPDPRPDGGVVPLGEGADGGTYYDADPIEHMRRHLCMLAYDMNDKSLTFGHGAPLRLRNEIELGFKQVKWISAIEFVADSTDIGSGFGGYNQDHEFFGYRQPIEYVRGPDGTAGPYPNPTRPPASPAPVPPRAHSEAGRSHQAITLSMQVIARQAAAPGHG